MNLNRMQKLNAEINAHYLDCLVLVPGANMVYLTDLHFHLGDRPTAIFFRPGKPTVMVLPELEMQKIAAWPELIAFPWSDEEGYANAFRNAAAELALPGKKIGVEAFSMRVVESQMLRESAPGVKLVPADNLVSKLRMRKDADELAAMHRAAELAQQAMQVVVDQFRPGMTEKEVAAKLKMAGLETGAQKISFDPIVSGGPNAANPHATPSSRPVKPGDFLLIDWGVYVDDYASDITRTWPVGEMEDEMRTIYDLVKAANAAGRAAVKPGVTCQEVDAATRKVIADAGYGDYFTHRTGHGLGMEVHEAPFIVQGDQTVLELGMTFTIEPGIYLPNRNGVRIEDDVVVTEDGCESLTSYSREWTPVG